MARKFLYFFALIIVLVIASAFVLRIYATELTRWAMVPTTKFEKQAPLKTNIYDNPAMWYSGPQEIRDNPTTWRPTGAPSEPAKGNAAIFFVHPTSYITKAHWNAPLDDSESQTRAKIFLRGLASPFADAGDIWAPRYRQAAMGAFLTTKPEGQEALDLAYSDVLQAFDHFIATQPKNRPIILAAHSQGSRHLTYLLRDRIAGTKLAKRIVAAYVIGWPISVEGDLPKMGLPACTGPDQTGCVIAWQSFAEPAEYENITLAYDATTAFNGAPRRGTHILCTNPLNGGALPDATADGNLGTLHPNGDLSQGELIAKMIPARCDEKGFLLIGDAPDLGPYRLPGNNYHVYDIPLFWSNLRADALNRLQKFRAR